ncbi:hypothetical protein [Vampirovibrio sp.]|uniref:hypothetical protein n=1 Tax=Vampirovibrio sp. TaxID=2717857 RepID=UPI003593E86D
MNTPSQTSPANPFKAIATQRPLVAIPGQRNGYIQLATATEITTYANLPESLFTAAKDWAALLEQSGSPRVYWITLSEVTRHLHIHLFPRWPQDSIQGIALFETRDTQPHPLWTPEQTHQLTQWANRHQVTLG